jgi:hypothetical protein
MTFWFAGLARSHSVVASFEMWCCCVGFVVSDEPMLSPSALRGPSRVQAIRYFETSTITSPTTQPDITADSNLQPKLVHISKCLMQSFQDFTVRIVQNLGYSTVQAGQTAWQNIQTNKRICGARTQKASRWYSLNIVLCCRKTNKPTHTNKRV